MQGERTIVRQLVPLPNSRRTRRATGTRLIRGPFFVPEGARWGCLEIVRYLSLASRPPGEALGIRPRARLAALELRDRRRRGGALGRHKSWRLSDDRTAFAEEPITLEPRKVAWQSPS